MNKLWLYFQTLAYLKYKKSQRAAVAVDISSIGRRLDEDFRTILLF